MRVREPDWHQHRMFRTPELDVHVHIFAPDCVEVRRNLAFRDRLKANIEDRRLYESVKRKLAGEDWPDMNAYARAKSEVVEQIIARAMSHEAMIDYYSKRSHEYERIYHKPERQADLALLRAHLRALLAGRRVIEVACGTGYWTAAIADAAASIIATDASEEVLEIARLKGVDPSRVSFRLGDAWRVNEQAGDFDAGLAAFWYSHVPREQLPAFLAGFGAALKPGARVVFADNRFVTGSSTPISRSDNDGNTYQLRRLDDGSTYEVLKNFPTRAELITLAEQHGRGVEVVEWEYFWCLSYEPR